MRAEFAVVGDPVHHSLSPQIHQAAFTARGLEGWRYRRVQVPGGQLEHRWEELARRFAGINVTAPHKLSAFRLCARVTPRAWRCKSVNTVTFGPSGAVGDSTDGPGFLAALREARPAPPGAAVILGAGGAARAVAAELQGAGCRVQLAARDRARAEAVSEELGLRVPPAPITAPGLARALDGADLLVNATPVGGDGLSSPLPDGVELSSRTAVVDLVYWPARTPLLRTAASRGCPTASGLVMLVEQAALAFELWSGLSAPRSQMMQAVLEESRRGGG